MPSKLQQRKQARRELNQRTGGGRCKEYLKERRAVLPRPKTKYAEGLKGKLAKVQVDFERVLELTERINTLNSKIDAISNNKRGLDYYSSEYKDLDKKHVELNELRRDLDKERHEISRIIFVNYDLEHELDDYFKQKYKQKYGYSYLKNTLNSSGTTTTGTGGQDYNGLSSISLFFRRLIFEPHLFARKQQEPHLVVFPMLGSVWNYLFAKGLLDELQRRGFLKSVKLVTLNVSESLVNYPQYGYTKESVVKELNSQINSIFKKNRGIKNVTVFDFSSDGYTMKLLQEVFTARGIDISHGQIGDHQTLGYGGPTPIDVYAKLIAPDGKQIIVKREKAEQLMQRGYRYYHGRAIHDRLLMQDSRKGLAESKEILYVFGRLYYYMDFIKDVLRDIH